MQYEEIVVGFIGCGEIAQTIIKGILRSGLLPAERLKASTSSPQTSNKATNLGITYASNNEIKSSCDVIVLCVRPFEILNVLGDIPQTAVVISTAAGITIEAMEEQMKDTKTVIRVMPNIGSSICCSFTGLCYNKAQASTWEIEVSKWLFEAVGIVEIIDESLIGHIIAASGSAICLFLSFVSELTKAVSAEGLPYELAIRACTSTMLNSATLLDDSGYDAEGLINSIKVPNGTTEAGFNVFKNGGFSDLIAKSVRAIIDRNNEISKFN